MTTRGGQTRHLCIACAILSLAVLGALLLVGCAGRSESPRGAADSRQGHRTGSAERRVVVPSEALTNTPRAHDLQTPGSAVRSYLDWISYGYRIGRSDVASPTMTPTMGDRVEAYIRYNLQNGKLIDQHLDSITFGLVSTETSRAIISAQEKWTYRYVSVTGHKKTVAGPYPASYETTYTLIKAERGWLVDDVAVKNLGVVK